MTSIRQIIRRLHWFLHNLTLGKAVNYFCLAFAYLIGKERIHAWPAVLKIDISPMCNLGCPVCVHAEPGTNKLLQKQGFKGKRMSLEQYRQLVEEARGKVAAFSLYYLGDPFMHPDIDEMCRMARDAGINVHLSTNFSFRFSDSRIEEIANSGVTHLTVCVDGFSQETYGKTRHRGNIGFVLANLKRLCSYKKRHGLKLPRIEVQYIKFKHNIHELEEAMAFFSRMGIDHVENYWGMVNNYSDLEPENYEVFGPLQNNLIPRCYWPFATMMIKYNGDAIPCCNFRHAVQYAEGEDARPIGNVFAKSIRAVWDSPEYWQTRQLCGKPESAFADGKLSSHFCYGCPALFHTNYEKNVKTAPDFTVD